MNEVEKLKIIFETNFTDLKKDIGNISSAVKDIDTSKAEKELRSLEKATKDTSAATNNFSKSLISIGAAYAGFSALKSIVQSSIDFGKSLSNISTIIDTNVESLSDMGNEIKKISKETPQSLDDLANGLYDIRSAGISAADQFTVLNGSAKLATAGLGTTAQATDIATSAINAWGLKGKEAEGVFNTLFQAINYGKVTLPQLSQGFGAVASTVQTAGIKIDDFMAAVASLTTTGLPASEAYASLRGALTSLIRPGEDLTKVMKSLGVNTFPELIKKTGGFVPAMQAVRNQFKGNEQDLLALMGRVEGYNALLSLTGNLSGSYNQILGDMRTKTDNLAEAFEKQKQSAAGQLEIFKNNFKVMGVELGDKLLPELAKFSQVLLDNKDDIQKFASSLLDVVITIGNQFLPVVKTLTTFLANNKELVVKFAEGFLAFQAANLVIGQTQKTISGLVSSFTFLTSPIGALTVSLGVLVATWQYYKNSADNARKATEEVAKSFQESFGNTEGVQKFNNLLAQRDQILRVTSREDALKSIEINKQLGESFYDLYESIGGDSEYAKRQLEGLAVGSEEWKIKTKELVDVQNKEFLPTQQKFIDGVEKEIEANKTLNSSINYEEAIKKVKDFQKINDDELKTIVNDWITQAGKSGDLGKAFIIGISQGMTSSDVIKQLEGVGVSVTESSLKAMTASAIQSKDVGALLISYYAQGIINEKEYSNAVAEGATFEGVQAMINTTANYGDKVFNVAAQLGAGYALNIAQNMSNNVPAIQQVINRIRKILETMNAVEKASAGGFDIKNQAKLLSLKTDLVFATNELKGLEKQTKSISKLDVSKFAVPAMSAPSNSINNAKPLDLSSDSKKGKSEAKKKETEENKKLNEQLKIQEDKYKEITKSIESGTDKLKEWDKVNQELSDTINKGLDESKDKVIDYADSINDKAIKAQEDLADKISEVTLKEKEKLEEINKKYDESIAQRIAKSQEFFTEQSKLLDQQATELTDAIQGQEIKSLDAATKLKYYEEIQKISKATSEDEVKNAEFAAEEARIRLQYFDQIQKINRDSNSIDEEKKVALAEIEDKIKKQLLNTDNLRAIQSKVASQTEADKLALEAKMKSELLVTEEQKAQQEKESLQTEVNKLEILKEQQRINTELQKVATVLNQANQDNTQSAIDYKAQLDNINKLQQDAITKGADDSTISRIEGFKKELLEREAYNRLAIEGDTETQAIIAEMKRREGLTDIERLVEDKKKEIDETRKANEAIIAEEQAKVDRLKAIQDISKQIIDGEISSREQLKTAVTDSLTAQLKEGDILKQSTITDSLKELQPILAEIEKQKALNQMQEGKQIDLTTIEDKTNLEELTKLQNQKLALDQSKQAILDAQSQLTQALAETSQSAGIFADQYSVALKRASDTTRDQVNSMISDLSRLMELRNQSGLFSEQAVGTQAISEQIKNIQIGNKGFAEGGFTGNIGTSDVAGVVHGQEYVVNAKSTGLFRPVLEAMNSFPQALRNLTMTPKLNYLPASNSNVNNDHSRSVVINEHFNTTAVQKANLRRYAHLYLK